MATFDAAPAFVTAFLVVAAVTPFVRKYALRWKLGDKPNGRDDHANVIPHVGGVGIVIGSVAGLLAAGVGGDSGFCARLIAPVALIVALGLTDDMKNLRARQKLSVQVVAAFLFALLGVRLFLGLPLFDGSAIFAVLVTSFYLVGMSSAVNLIDGHDGLAAGLSAISAAALAWLAWTGEQHSILLLSLVVMGACLGFLLHNFPPGRVYMGDTGSMFLGTLLGVIACSCTMAEPGVRMLIGVGFILSVPMMDSWLAIARRLALHRPVFQADNHHIHHVLSSFGFTARQTLVILYLMQAVMAFLGILVTRGFVVPLILGVVLFVLTFAGFIRVMVVTDERLRSVPSFAPNSVPSLEK